ncbi:uncharacterized protein LOC120840795 isoform X3 [Ixodes scapularis]|uniref:uncharacterized protein LOC120840795 isoform X3 n=1 Tax=Ixodes scapularis TaxID=6945 RepID=UPI001A9FDBEB|nr:uncharacterized protein LOC120840795 isoform X3 [Ixodes scapularis]
MAPISDALQVQLQQLWYSREWHRGGCICCRKMGTALTRVQPAGCITEHPEFSMLCLNIPVLRLLYFELRGLGYPMHDDIHSRLPQGTAWRTFFCAQIPVLP